MKKIFYLLIAFAGLIIFPGSLVMAQGGVGINAAGTAPDSSAVLDVSSVTKGELMPRMSTAQRNAISNPAKGLFIYNTDCDVVNFNAGTPANPNWATLNSSNALAAGVSIVANPLGAICAGSSVTFSATPGQNNLSPAYQWQVNGANVGANSNIYTSTSLNNGDVVSCILTSNVNCVTGSPATSNAITMSVNTVPAITGTAPASFCSGSAVSLGASASLGTINWYPDSIGGSSLSTGASFTISGLTSTVTYYVDATANGCTTGSRAAVTATAFPGSPGQPGTITGPSSIVTDSVITYSINALSNAVSYTWTVSLLSIVSGQGATSVGVKWGDTSGLGSVSVVANNPCGTSVPQTLPVYVGKTFTYTGSGQTFMVPPGITSVTITAYGAQGGSGSGDNGGLGGSAKGTLSVTPGETLYIFAGGQNGYNGGGNGGQASSYGGGESDVRVGDSTINSWVIVAGGGGGGSNQGGTGGSGGTGNACVNGAGGGAGTSGAGGTGGVGTCTNGGDGGSPNGGWSGGGGGGGLTSGGQGSSGNGYANAGNTGSMGQGGSYGTQNACSCGSNAAGGGGGYYGGGGTSVSCCSGGSGGGGSSWASASMTNTSFSGGVQSGNGQVVITW